MDQVAIRNWGNSQGIRLPKELLDRLNLKVSDVLDVVVEDDAIVLRKSFKHRTFEERLEEYGGNIDICELDWGEPKGKELL